MLSVNVCCWEMITLKKLQEGVKGRGRQNSNIIGQIFGKITLRLSFPEFPWGVLPRATPQAEEE